LNNLFSQNLNKFDLASNQYIHLNHLRANMFQHHIIHTKSDLKRILNLLYI